MRVELSRCWVLGMLSGGLQTAITFWADSSIVCICIPSSEGQLIIVTALCTA
jgi:hypothetical protein